MEKIEVESCYSCPFGYEDYDDYAVGYDTLLICCLARFKNLKESIVDAYDTIGDREYVNDQNFPDWCPLNDGEVIVSKQ